MTITNDNSLCNFVLFGATGDLVTRKLIPALFSAFLHNNLSHDACIIVTGRQPFTQEQYITFIGEKYTAFYKDDINNININEIEVQSLWQQFVKLLCYIQIDVTKQDEYQKLANKLNSNIINIYYLSTAPSLFKQICENLAHHKLNHINSRIVLEKPLGHDLASSNDINDFIAKFFEESQIYRIDHYLGKESVQNLMAIRFGNTLFEALWRRQWINSIQITISETLGVNTRGEFYDKTGAMRDMLQNHLLQLLCIVAMEPPFNLEADTIRDEKLKVLKSLKILSSTDVLNNVVSGQYKRGSIDGVSVDGYLDENNIAPNSNTETFVTIKAEIQNWRWADVPFYLRTGKRMQQQLAQIVIQFKDIPCKIFPVGNNNFANRLIIRLQPDETIQLYFLAKKPGDTNELKPVYLDLNFTQINQEIITAKQHKPEGYERLLIDVMRGKLTLFVRRDECQAAWQWVEPILNTWRDLNITPKSYIAGTWGPASSSILLAKDNFCWHEELV